MKQRGFTLLEVLVATLIMGIAVVGLLSSLSTSMRNGARLTDYDRAVMIGRTRMDALLSDHKLPIEGTVEGDGWRARIAPFELPPSAGPGTPMLQSVALEIWWMQGEERRTFQMTGYRRNVMP